MVWREQICAIAVLAGVFAIGGCNRPIAPPATTAAKQSVTSMYSPINDDDLKPDYSVERIGPNDLLQVSVNDLMGVGVTLTTRQRATGPGGTIYMPLFDAPFKVTGLTDSEAQLAISKRYRDLQIIPNAIVTVFRNEVPSTLYTILGRGVGTPGEYAITPVAERLTTALAGAHVRLEGQSHVVIIRRDGTAKPRTLEIPVAQLMAGDPHSNVFMHERDVVILPMTNEPVSSDDNQLNSIEDDDLMPDYSVQNISPGDAVEMICNDVWSDPVTSVKQMTIAADGRIEVPKLPQPFKIAGMTAVDAECAIAKQFHDLKIQQIPIITLLRRDQYSAMYNILGANVDRPGTQKIPYPDHRLSAVLAFAGVHLERQRHILVLRTTGNSQTRTIDIPVARLMAGDARTDICMRPGDAAILPAIDGSPATHPTTSIANTSIYFVGGTSVKYVGTYSFLVGKTTVTQGITAAGGVSDGYVSVFRQENGKVWLVLDNVRYTELLSKTASDIFLHPSDTVMVNAATHKWPAAVTQQQPMP